MTEPGRLFEVTKALHDGVVGLFGESGLVAPARNYVHYGEVAWDCEQLVTAVKGIVNGSPNELVVLPISCTTLTTVTAEVWCTRDCQPTAAANKPAPTTESLMEAAEIILRDGDVLWEFAGRIKEFMDDSCALSSVGPLEAVGPDGKHGGWALTINYQVW